MSDLLAFLNKNITGADIPRYIDLIHQKQEEKPEEIIMKFNKLRRKETE